MDFAYQDPVTLKITRVVYEEATEEQKNIFRAINPQKAAELDAKAELPVIDDIEIGEELEDPEK